MVALSGEDRHRRREEVMKMSGRFPKYDVSISRKTDTGGWEPLLDTSQGVSRALWEKSDDAKDKAPEFNGQVTFAKDIKAGETVSISLFDTSRRQKGSGG